MMNNCVVDQTLNQSIQSYLQQSAALIFPDDFPVILVRFLRRFLFIEYFLSDGEIRGINRRQPKDFEMGIKELLMNALEILHPEWPVDYRIEKVKIYLDRLPEIKRISITDLQAAYDGDPATECYEEIVWTYPGFFAINVYRTAHELHSLGVRLLPRMMSEYAHSKTGIDIHPGAQIGRSFFIDHGTGVVIGETTEIGDHVKLYQGVTLGALSTRGGQKLKKKKRHPTISDGVTVYAGASILGGNTMIGEDAVIGCNAFITESVDKGSKICNEIRGGLK